MLGLVFTMPGLVLMMAVLMMAVLMMAVLMMAVLILAVVPMLGLVLMMSVQEEMEAVKAYVKWERAVQGAACLSSDAYDVHEPFWTRGLVGVQGRGYGREYDLCHSPHFACVCRAPLSVLVPNPSTLDCLPPDSSQAWRLTGC